GGDSNLYGYVLGDPVNFVDTMGLSNHTLSHQTGSFIQYNGTYNCRDCTYGSIIVGIGVSCLVGPELFAYAIANPIKTIYWANVVNDSFNPSLPPITPHGAGVNIILQGCGNVCSE
ncbi:MAG: hypothetical protein ABFS12_18055, partial [Bacteroidota bacterium]